MTAEKFTEEILYKSHSLGIKDELWELSSKLREEDRTLDLHGSIEQAYRKLTE
jgi:hypothetical protein|tara:strand:+ start:1932 stop:2090 length:159 start_codon:yes stop_codon:yes gene_type:complete